MMLTHNEAQALISTSLETPLDDDIEQILADHLAGCEECRMFAASSQRLSSALHALPTVPPSPAVRQAVWAAIDTPPPWWTRIGGAVSGQTAAIASTAAIALLVIAFAVLAIIRITGGDDGEDDATRLAAGTQEAIALATATAEPTVTQPPAAEPTATAPAATQTEPPPMPTEPEETVTPTTAPAEPTRPAPTVAETPTPAAAPAETEEAPSDLTGDEPEPTVDPDTTRDVVAALFEATAAATETAVPTETPVPPTSTPEATETPVPTETPEPTATSEPEPANLTVTLLSQDDEPIPDACFALLQDEAIVLQSCDTPEVETAEFASNGNTGFFDVPAGTYTLRMTSQPGEVEVEDREVTIDPGSEDIVTITAEVATPTVVPTETPAPTETPEPEPTETPAPTETPTALPTETPAPTETPSPEPTESPVPPTSTPEPTAAPEPTQADEATSPPIEPVDGQAIEVEEAPDLPPTAQDSPLDQIISPAEATAGVDEEPVPTETSEEVTDLTEATDEAPSATVEESEDDPTPTETGAQVIEPIEGDGTSAAEVPDEVETAVAGTETPTSDGTGSAGYDLSEAPFYSDGEPWGDVTARLAWQDEQVTFTGSPDSFSLESELLSVQTATDGDSQYLEVCADTGCSEATLESGEGSFTDESIGWLDNRLIYQRVTGDGEIEIRELIWNGGVTSDAQLGTASEPIDPLGLAYPVASGTLIPGTASWLLVSESDASIVDDNPYGDIRLARTSFGEPIIAYVAGGQLIVAEQASPGTPIATLPFNGVDFDISPDLQSAVISTGSGLEIWSLSGELLGASDTSTSTGSVLWLGGGIVFLDLTTNSIRLVDPALLAG